MGFHLDFTSILLATLIGVIEIGALYLHSRGIRL
jgi:hypothetical protein